MVEFVDIAPVSSSIIMVVGVGGGGCNAVNHMYKLGIADVSFMVCNTDWQALGKSPIPNQVRLGTGLGAGNKPPVGRAAAEASIDEIKEIFSEKDIKMVFVTAGMGGGTGTGAAPVIAKAAKEMGILTVAIVTIPFKTEGPRRIMQALNGIEEIRHNVDSLLVVNNENINEIYGDLTLSEAFGKADDILAEAAKSIADIITQENRVNVDFADVRTVMKDSGIALMGSACGSGEKRALEVAEAAMNSPLLNHRDVAGAQNVLMTITSGNKEVKMSEVYEITQFLQNKTGLGLGTDLIWGAGTDKSLDDDIRITIIATGFGVDSIPMIRDRYVDVVGPASKPERDGKEHLRDAPAPQRQTISLIDQETGSGSAGRPDRKTRTEDEGDEFAVVTRDREEPAPVIAMGYDRPSVSIADRQREKMQEEWKPAVEVPVVPEMPQQTAGEWQSVVESPQPQLSQQSVAEPETVPPVTAESAAEPEPASPDKEDITALTEEQIERIPAYLRRRMKLYAGAPAGGKVSRETLKNEGGHGGSHSRGGGAADGEPHLFD